MNRSHKLGELRIENVNQEVNLYGWVKNHRDFGEIIFIDLGDMYGITQVVVENDSAKLVDIAKSLKGEDCINVTGVVRERQDKNTQIPTGEIEILCNEISIINKAKVLPMDISEDSDSSEDTRFKYRYLDLRRNKIINNLRTRHKVSRSFRNFLDSNEFLEIETPILTKSTPEGARDYLVPSRVNKNKFYALPQSPQIYKNLLMNGTIDKYYQFAKCFRDEDLRSDRQPEFTQIDIEMAFTSPEGIQDITEAMMKHMMKDVMNITFEDAFEKMTYDHAMTYYGLDKPDLRFDMKLVDITSVFEKSEFKIFKNAPYVKMINVKDSADKYSRKDLGKVEEIAKQHQAKGMPWLKYKDGEFAGTIVKVLTEEELNKIKEMANVEENDMLIFASDNFNVVSAVLGNLRNHFAKELNLYSNDEFRFVWIVDWPLFEYDEEDERYYAMHHPFTMPKGYAFTEDVETQQALAYDLVLNGYEIGGGSIRINNTELQGQMFELLGFTKDEIEEQFGFLTEAYSYGAPYHGGIAFGFDRLLLILTKSESIKEVIAFPKNNKAQELLMQSPSLVSDEQLNELHIDTIAEEGEE